MPQTRLLATLAIAISIAGAAAISVIAIDRQGVSSSISTQADTAGAVRDSFRRPNDPLHLGTTDNGKAWRVRGTWGVLDHAAYLSAPAGENFAVVRMGSRDGTVRVTLATLAGGCGVLFRYRDPQNYLELVPIPRLRIWSLDEVSAGKRRVLTTRPSPSMKDGTAVSVHVSGTIAKVAIDGRALGSLPIPDQQSATAVGLVAYGPNVLRARWKDFVATPEPIGLANPPVAPGQ